MIHFKCVFLCILKMNMYNFINKKLFKIFFHMIHYALIKLNSWVILLSFQLLDVSFSAELDLCWLPIILTSVTEFHYIFQILILLNLHALSLSAYMLQLHKNSTLNFYLPYILLLSLAQKWHRYL